MVYRDFSYSILITGPFLDWGLSVVPFIINVGARSAEGSCGSVLIYPKIKFHMLEALLPCLADIADHSH